MQFDSGSTLTLATLIISAIGAVGLGLIALFFKLWLNGILDELRELKTGQTQQECAQNGMARELGEVTTAVRGWHRLIRQFQNRLMQVEARTGRLEDTALLNAERIRTLELRLQIIPPAHLLTDAARPLTSEG